MRKLKKALSVLTVITLMLAIIPVTAMSAFAAQSDAGVKFDIVKDVEPGIHKLVFQVKVPDVLGLLNVMFSYDTNVIQPVHSQDTTIDVDVPYMSDPSNYDDAAPFNMLLAAPQPPPGIAARIFTFAPTAWAEKGNRAGFSATVYHSNGRTADSNGSYVDVFEFYFRLQDGKSLDNIIADTFKFENGVDPGGFVLEIFPLGNIPGIFIQGADANETYNWGHPDQATYPDELDEVVSPYVDFAAEQEGGVSGTTDSAGIKLTFTNDVSGLAASDITITDGTGAVTKGNLSGSGREWMIELVSVTTEGNVTVSVADFGDFTVDDGAKTVAVYKAPSGKTDVSNTITFNGGDYEYDGISKPLTATSTDTSGGAFTYSYVGTGDTTYPETNTAPINVGTYSVIATYESDTALGRKTVDLAITPIVLTINGVIATDRDYNGTTDIALTGGSLAGVLSGDAPDVGFDLGTGSIANADAGNGKAVTTTITLTGAKSGNYTLTQPSNLTVNISLADYTYTVNSTQNIKIGSGLSAITVAPAGGTDADGLAVEGTVDWFSDAGRTTSAIDSDLSSLSLGAIQELYWRFTPSSTNFKVKEGSATFTIVEGDPQNLTFSTPSSITKVYGDPAFTNAATNDSSDGGAVVYTSSDLNVATVDVNTGQVTILKNGNTVITATAAAIPGKYAEGTANYTLTVNPRTITVSAGTYVISKVYDGTISPGTATGDLDITNILVADSGVVTVTPGTVPNFTDANVHTGTITMPISISGDTDGNYTLGSTNTVTVPANITPLPIAPPTVTIASGPFTYTGSPIEPDFTVVMSDGTPMGDSDYTASFTDNTNAGTATLTVAPKSDGGNYTWTPNAEASFDIEKITYGGVTTGNTAAKYGNTGTFDLVTGLGLPEGYVFGPVTVIEDVYAILLSTPTISGTVLSFNLVNDAALVGETAEIEIPVISSTNYEPFTITITITLSNKEPQTIIFDETGPITKTYGEAPFINKVSGQAPGSNVTYASSDPAVATVDSDGNVIILKAGTTTITATAGETLDYLSSTASYTLTVNKAALVVQPKSFSINRGDDMPVLEVEYIGLVGGDTGETVATLSSGTLEMEIRNADNTDVLEDTNTMGAYKIIFNGSPVFNVSDKYSISIQDGLLTIDATDVTVTFMNGNTVYAAKVVAPPATTIDALPADPTNGNYTFSGWYTEVNGGGTRFYASTTVTSNLTVYAYWTGSGSGGGGGSSKTGTGTDIEPAATNGSFDSGSTYTLGSGNNLVFTVQKDHALFDGVAVDDNVLAPDDYKDESGSTIITLLPAYLDTLSAGSHTLTVNFKDGEKVSAKFTVAEEPGSSVTPDKTVAPSGSFSDVQTNAWYYNDVMYVYNNGLMYGTSADKFSPDMTMTRGMIVTVLYRQAGSPSVSGLADPFSDVPENEYYAAAVKWAAQNSIVSGYGNSRFGPDDNITREQLASIIYRYEQFSGKIPPNTLPAKTFNDGNQISEYAKIAVNTLTMQGIISGKTGDMFDPKGNATRAEFASMLHRFVVSI